MSSRQRDAVVAVEAAEMGRSIPAICIAPADELFPGLACGRASVCVVEWIPVSLISGAEIVHHVLLDVEGMGQRSEWQI